MLNCVQGLDGSKLGRMNDRFAYDAVLFIQSYFTDQALHRSGEIIVIPSFIADYNSSRSYSAPVLYGMPILESASIIYRESRLDSLQV